MIALFAAVVVGVVSTSTPAHAGTATPSTRLATAQAAAAPVTCSDTESSDGWMRIINVATGLGLGVAGSRPDDGAPIIQWGERPVRDQAWKLDLIGNGFVALRNANRDPWSTLGIYNSKAIQFGYTAAADQMWCAVPVVVGRFMLVNKKSGKCLAIPAANPEAGIQAIEWPCNGEDDQMWFLRFWS